MKYIHKISLGVLLFIIVATSLFIFKENRNTSDTINIGFIAGLSGTFSPYGEMMRDGAILAMEEINASGSQKKVKLIIQDNNSEIKNSVSAYKNIHGSISSFISGGSGVVLGLAPLANADEVVLLNVSALNPDIRNAGDYVFSNINDATVEVSAMASFIKNSGINNVAVLYQDDSAGSSAKDVFVKSFESLHGNILSSDAFLGKASDVHAQLLKIKQLHTEGVYVPGYPENIALILKQAHELGITTKWFSVNVEDKKLIDIAGSASEGLIYTSTSFDSTSNDPDVARFVTHFKKRFGVVPTVYAATAYDGVKLLAEAGNKVGDNGTEIKKYLYGVKNWNGVSGITSFDSTGSTNKSIVFKTVKNGQFIQIK